MIHVTINGGPVEAAEGSTIMGATESVGTEVLSLHRVKDVHQYDSCRICVMEVEGMRNLQVSCMAKVRGGMAIKTHSFKVLEAKKVLYELLLSNHPKDCLNCGRNTNYELRNLGCEPGATESHFEGAVTKSLVDISPSTTRDTSKCILCRHCMTTCKEVQKVGAIQTRNRGFDTVVSLAAGLPLNSTVCVMCDQCMVVCPTGVLKETNGLTPARRTLADPDKRVVAQVVPIVRAALGEEFGSSMGVPVTGKMVTILHEIGFDGAFGTSFSADLTILEGGTELPGRLNAVLKGDDNEERLTILPMIISYSPGWIKYTEHQFPGELDHLSTCKSPHIMLRAVVKSFYAERTSTDPKDIFVVSVMSCTAKKYEIQRPEMEVDGHHDVDAVLVTRELARMTKKAGLDFVNLPEGKFNLPSGLGTGTADTFGVTGGVMEAALRTVYKVVTGRELLFEELHVTPIAGLGQIKTASTTIEEPLPVYGHLNGVIVDVAVTSGLEGASKFIEEVAADISSYHFIEVMGCPGGCINDEGQPYCTEGNYREKRSKTLYSEDERKMLCKSHENPDLMKLYNEYLRELNGHLSHHLLHTHHVRQGKYNRLVK